MCVRELNEHNLSDYLRAAGQIDRNEVVSISPLSGGVSNAVFYIARSPDAHARRERDFVLKQARGQLRVAQPWFCSVERIWREVEVLDTLGLLLSPRKHMTSILPTVYFQDRDNYLFTMQAAPRESRTWKADLLDGILNTSIAAECGALLGNIHGRTWGNTALKLFDRTYFRELRIDPYYRATAKKHTDLAPLFDELILSLEQHAYCVVHGDFSPKNLLLWEEPNHDASRLMLIDYEVGHDGDPAFDVGFFLAHLIAKGVHLSFLRLLPNHAGFPTLGLCHEFLRSYLQSLRSEVPRAEAAEPAIAALQQRVVMNLAGCLLARVDGKSPLEYLSHEIERETVRSIARRLFDARPATIEAGLTMAVEILQPVR
jgi:5-methylthioribose kinase